MAFQLVYYSQTDPKWKDDLLGLGEPGDTLGLYGCAVTSIAMLLSGHGLSETPKSLNNKLKNNGGFVSSYIVWGAVSKIYPQVNLKGFIPCTTTDAPLAQIDASIAAGQPVIVMVDSSSIAGLQTHWVVLYARKGDDYLMLDPVPFQPDVKKETYLMPRYSQGQSLKKSIQHVILYECFGVSGGIAIPSGASTPASTPAPVAAPAAPLPGPHARVKAEITAGLNIRSSVDTSSMANVVTIAPAGSLLSIVEKDGEFKVGAINQWLRVRDAQGNEGYTAAWHLEKVASAAPTTAPVTPPNNTTVNTLPPAPAQPSTSAPTTITPPTTTPVTTAPSTPPKTPKPVLESLTVVVSSAVGSSGLRLRKTPSSGGSLVAILSAGTHLAVLDKAENARGKIGKANQWILVRDSKRQRGYVSAEFVEEEK